MAGHQITSAVTDADIDAISDRVGVGPGGWDVVKPESIIAAVLEHYRQRQETPDLAAARAALEAARDAVETPLCVRCGHDQSWHGYNHDDSCNAPGCDCGLNLSDMLAEVPTGQLLDAHEAAAVALGRAEAGALTREQEDAVLRKRVAEVADERGVVVFDQALHGTALGADASAVLAALGVPPAQEDA